MILARRYASPLTEAALAEMKRDGVERAGAANQTIHARVRTSAHTDRPLTCSRAAAPTPVAFSQFPQWSCTTTGSSLNELWRGVAAAGLSGVRWSVLDRWPTHAAFVSALADKVQQVAPPRRPRASSPPASTRCATSG